MTTVEYDEMSDAFHASCSCGWAGNLYMRSRDADREADAHDDWHDNQVEVPR